MKFDRILVRATNWVGDAVMSLPALQALRRQFAQSHISVLARPSVADLYVREPVCDEVIVYCAPKGWNGLSQKLALAGALRGKQFDCAVLLQNAFEAAALAWLARARERVGYNRDGRALLLTRAVPLPRKGEIPVHQRFYYLELLKRAGLIESYPSDVQISLSGAAQAAEQGRVLLENYQLHDPVIGVSPGAAFGSAKRWLSERFVEAAVLLGRRQNASIVVFGTSDEVQVASEVAEGIVSGGVNAISVAGRTSLGEFIDMAAACELFLTNDSGSMHIASALGVPTVVVFGPTDENATGPAGCLNAVLREPVECSPCHLRECPIDHRCMARVSAERVAGAATQLLEMAPNLSRARQQAVSPVFQQTPRP